MQLGLLAGSEKAPSVGNLLSSAIICPVQQDAIDCYIDKVRIWVKRPLTREEEGRLPPGTFIKRKADRWRRLWRAGYRQRIDLYRPNRENLELFTRRPDVRFNYAEVALDVVFSTWGQLQDAYDLVLKCHYKKYRRSTGGLRPRIKIFRWTRYTDRRSAANNFVLYADLPSRMTGEVYCLHLEWRFTGARALERANIKNLLDLMALNHREFWQKRLLFANIDLQKLGRYWRLYFAPNSCRRSQVYVGPRGYRSDLDARTGRILFVNADSTTQGVLDRYGSMLRARDALIPVDVTPWLPDTSASL